MKKSITFLLLSLSFLSFSQQCGFDEYLKSLNRDGKQLNTKIRTEITNIVNKKSKSTANSDDVINIPVVFNLVYPSYYQFGQGANVNASILQTQIDILNDRFGGGLGGVDTKIKFYIAKKDIHGFNNTGIKRFYGDESYQPGTDTDDVDEYFKTYSEVDAEIKKNKDNGFPQDTFLNIWIVDLIGKRGDDNLYGYSSSPIINASPVQTIDGVVIDYEELNKYTATHEIGHWLGLFHIFETEGLPNAPLFNNCTETDCETQGDFICDTDTVSARGQNNIAPGTCKGYNCNGQITDVVQNFMDYQFDKDYCYNHFTLGQKNRMRDVLEQYRTTIYQNSIFNINDYSTSPGFSNNTTGTSGGLETIPYNIYDYCETCYEPSINLPITCSDKKQYDAVYKSNLLIHPTTEGYGGTGARIYNIYKIVCNEAVEDGVITIPNDTDGTPGVNRNKGSQIYIINDNFFLVFRSDQSGENFGELRLYKKINGSWQLNKKINLGTTYYFRHEKHGFFITSFIKSKLGRIEKIDLDTGIRTFIGDFKAYDANHNIKFTDEGYLLYGKGGIIEDWHYNYNTKKYDLKKTINLPLADYLVDHEIDFSYSENYIFVTGYHKDAYRSTTYIKPYIFINLGNNIWIELQRLDKGSENTYINDQIIIMHSDNHYGGSTVFYKKNKTTGFFELENLSHLNPLNLVERNHIKSAKLSINNERKEIYIGDQILKLKDIFQTDESNLLSTTTTEICASSFSEGLIYTDYNIKLAGECNLSLDNKSATFIVNNRASLMPGLTIKGGNVSIKTTKSYNDCPFIERCNYSNDPKLIDDSSYTKKVLIEEPENFNEIKIYPNPTNDTFTISSNETITNYSLFNSLGTVVLNKEVNTNTVTVSIQNLPEGMYIIRTTLASGEIVVKKIIKN